MVSVACEVLGSAGGEDVASVGGDVAVPVGDCAAAGWYWTVAETPLPLPAAASSGFVRALFAA